MRYRIESGGNFEVRVPLEAYYGAHSQKSKDLFTITKHGLNRQTIKAFAAIKKSAAKANFDAGLISKEIENSISLSCDEIINGRLHGQFVTDLVQGGSGIAMNHNASEVIANRANELLGGEKGKYNLVDPIKHVNLNQDSVNTVLMASKFSAVRLTKKLMTETKKLVNSYNDKIKGLDEKTDIEIIKQEFLSLTNIVERDNKRLNSCLANLLEVNVTIPGEVTETDIFAKKYIKYLGQFVGEPIKQIKNPLDFDFHLDDVSILSSAIKLLISNLAKSANDLVTIAKKNNIELDSDSLMVIEVVRQVSYYVMGNDLTIQRAVEDGQTNQNIHVPIIFACLFEMLNLLRRTIRVYREKVIDTLKI